MHHFHISIPEIVFGKAVAAVGVACAKKKKFHEDPPVMLLRGNVFSVNHSITGKAAVHNAGVNFFIFLFYF